MKQLTTEQLKQRRKRLRTECGFIFACTPGFYGPAAVTLRRYKNLCFIIYNRTIKQIKNQK